MGSWRQRQKRSDQRGNFDAGMPPRAGLFDSNSPSSTPTGGALTLARLSNFHEDTRVSFIDTRGGAGGNLTGNLSEGPHTRFATAA